MSAKNGAFDESWFENSGALKPAVSIPPSIPEPVRPEGRVGWAAFLGALGGAGGGAAMLFVAREIALRIGSNVDIIAVIGAPMARFTDVRTGAFVMTIAVGAVLGI